MPISQKLVWQGVREIAQEKIQVTTFSRNNYGQSIVMIIFIDGPHHFTNQSSLRRIFIKDIIKEIFGGFKGTYSF